MDEYWTYFVVVWAWIKSWFVVSAVPAPSSSATTAASPIGWREYIRSRVREHKD